LRFALRYKGERAVDCGAAFDKRRANGLRTATLTFDEFRANGVKHWCTFSRKGHRPPAGRSAFLFAG
jgi:hypothetical protein